MNIYPGTKKQIIDISWKYNNKSDKYYQTATLYDYILNERQVLMLRDYKFNWKLTEERYCPGYSDFAGYHPCKKATVLLKDSYSLCFECEKSQGFKSAFFFGGEPNEYMREYLGKKHYIYLAFFSPNILKVGTAAEIRKFIRPIEQDALIYSYIAESDGFTIQDIEHDISKKLKITEAVSSSTKFKNLYNPPNIKLATERINNAHIQIKELYKDNERFFSWVYESLDIKVLSTIEDLFYPVSKVHRVPREEITCVVGEFKGIRGRFTVFENNSTLLAFDERKIIGRFIDEYIEIFKYSINSKISTDQLSMI